MKCGEKVMLNRLYKKLFKPRLGHIFMIDAPYSEAEGKLRWLLRCETHREETHIADTEELENPKMWQKLE
jgi:hypothetical protein